MRSISTSKPITASHSPWHGPVPYLFGILAAMMGLIAFALLMLACSYWEQSENQDRSNIDNKERDHENIEPVKVYEEKILVIMAGDEKPTFLATPVYHKRTIDDHVLVPASATAMTQENERSQHDGR